MSWKLDQAVLDYAKLLEVDADYSKRIKQTGHADGCMWRALGIERPRVSELKEAEKKVREIVMEECER